MSYRYPFAEKISLHVEGRISAEDALRQERTAREILRRLEKQPGLILADEVGMGKTFVALAVAASVALSDSHRRPVVVMVPPSLKEKWPADFEVFRERCLPKDLAERMRCARAERAVEFLKLLDDPLERRKQILFVTHGALSRSLQDIWVRLALIQRALRGRRGVDALRLALSRVMARLLRASSRLPNDEGFWSDLLATDYSKWLEVLHDHGVDPEEDCNPDTDDDPVPEAVRNALPSIDATDVFESLEKIPRRRSEHFEDRLRSAQKAISAEIRKVWTECIRVTRLHLPLLILDEAHHLKNPDTRLASLFRAPDAHEDAEEITRGALAGVFDRMLFLTATPFQLGHAELCSVLERFVSIRWDCAAAPPCGKEECRSEIRDLRTALDKAQEAAVRLDAAWGMLREQDLAVGDQRREDAQDWWQLAATAENLTGPARGIVRCYESANARMRQAEELLRPWVIRHLKPRRLPKPHEQEPRRRRLVGNAIRDDAGDAAQTGIPVSGEALLPFLLASRATSCAPESRPVFAEGLASSYEAFLHTRQAREGKEQESGAVPTDEDDDDTTVPEAEVDEATLWYLDQLEHLVPKNNPRASAAHPKVAATIQRVADLWEAGEKVLVFCHYVATGRALRQRISEAIEERVHLRASQRLHIPLRDVPQELERIGKRFFDEDSPLRRACDAEVSGILGSFPPLDKHRQTLMSAVRRSVRTPSFLVRFLPLGQRQWTAKDMAEAMGKPDRSGLTLRDLLGGFFRFLVEQCSENDRERYIKAVERIQTGSYTDRDVARLYSPDELQGDRPERLIPNVRLVNGTTASDTRQRLMLAFNTPFFPEVLVASSVLTEGVDLHLSCRHIIHHDLCWNPSTLEQRTGRIDRIGAKAERCGQSIHVYLPFVSETQDEKMYRVVMDRERWFSVVMSGEFRPDARTTEQMAQRVPFPAAAAERLAFDLQVFPGNRTPPSR